MRESTCSIPGCDRGPVVARSWCDMHYCRWKRHGDPEWTPPNREIERFWQKVHKTDGCWEWTGSVTSNGYGRFKSGLGRAGKGSARIEWAHRYSYRTFVGPIPDGLHIDHLCRNRKCVRPDHLEPVTCRENLRRGLGNQYTRREVTPLVP